MTNNCQSLKLLCVCISQIRMLIDAKTRYRWQPQWYIASINTSQSFSERSRSNQFWNFSEKFPCRPSTSQLLVEIQWNGLLPTAQAIITYKITFNSISSCCLVQSHYQFSSPFGSWSNKEKSFLPRNALELEILARLVLFTSNN